MHAKDCNGLTALHYACSSGAVETCRKLLEHGADRAIVEWAVEEAGQTVLQELLEKTLPGAAEPRVEAPAPEPSMGM